MKPASEITLGLALICIAGNAISSFAIGFAESAPGWAVLICVLLFNIWVRLMQIADLLQQQRKDTALSTQRGSSRAQNANP